MKLDIGCYSNTAYCMFTVCWNLDLTISHLPAESCSWYRTPDENRKCTISERWHVVSVLFRQWNYARIVVYIGEPSWVTYVKRCHVILNYVEWSFRWLVPKLKIKDRAKTASLSIYILFNVNTPVFDAPITEWHITSSPDTFLWVI
jgi:hypothetical protein